MRWVALAAYGACASCADMPTDTVPVLDGPQSLTVRELGPVPTPRVVAGNDLVRVDWVSSAPNVAVFDDHGLRAVGRGEAVVSAEIDGHPVSWRLTVELPVALRFEHAPGELLVGESVDLDLVVDGVRGPVSWRSSDDDVATVSEHGLVTGHEPGVVYISAGIGDAEAMMELSVAPEEASVAGP